MKNKLNDFGTIPSKLAHALQNKFLGAMTTDLRSNGKDKLWGQVSYVKTPFIEGMLFLSGIEDHGPCRATIHTENESINVSEELAKKLLSDECPVCLSVGYHKMDCVVR